MWTFSGSVKFCICTAWELGNAEDGEGMTSLRTGKFWEQNRFWWQLLQANNVLVLASLSQGQVDASWCERCNSCYLLLNLLWLLILSSIEILCLIQAEPLVPAVIWNRKPLPRPQLIASCLSQEHIKLSLLYCNFLVVKAEKEKQNHIFFCIFFKYYNGNSLKEIYEFVWFCFYIFTLSKLSQ